VRWECHTLTVLANRVDYSRDLQNPLPWPLHIRTNTQQNPKKGHTPSDGCSLLTEDKLSCEDTVKYWTDETWINYKTKIMTESQIKFKRETNY
jgi:hypothetical protein